MSLFLKTVICVLKSWSFEPKGSCAAVILAGVLEASLLPPKSAFWPRGTRPTPVLTKSLQILLYFRDVWSGEGCAGGPALDRKPVSACLWESQKGEPKPWVRSSLEVAGVGTGRERGERPKGLWGQAAAPSPSCQGLCLDPVKPMWYGQCPFISE